MPSNEIMDYLATMQEAEEIPTAEIVERAEEAQPEQEAKQETQEQTESPAPPESQKETWEDFQSPDDAPYMARQYTPPSEDGQSQGEVSEPEPMIQSQHPPVDMLGFVSKLEQSYQQQISELQAGNQADLEWIKARLATHPDSTETIDIGLRAQQ